MYDSLVEQTDLAPTIADLCGIPPADTHGRSLVPVLTGQNAPAPRKSVCAEFYDSLEVDMNYDGWFKLSVHHGIQFGELYDSLKKSDRIITKQHK